MGNSSSTNTNTNVPKENLNDKVDKLIQKFVKGIETYKTNDLREVKSFINAHEDGLPSSINKKEILEMIETVDKSLSFGPEDTDKSRINSDKGLFDHFYNINASSTQELRDKFLKEPLVAKNNMVDSVKNLFDPYTKLRSEVMFYRYKYIQINVILIIIIEQFQNIFDTSISAIGAEYMLKVEESHKLLKHFIELANTLAKQDNPDIENETRQTIHMLADTAYNKLNSEFAQMKEKIANVNSNTPKLLAQLLLDTNQITLDDLKGKERAMSQPQSQ